MNAQQKVTRAVDPSVVLGWGLFCFTSVSAIVMVALYLGFKH